MATVNDTVITVFSSGQLCVCTNNVKTGFRLQSPLQLQSFIPLGVVKVLLSDVFQDSVDFFFFFNPCVVLSLCSLFLYSFLKSLLEKK